MFVFVSNWTATITQDGSRPRHEYVFANLMVMCMLGSQIFTFLSRNTSVEWIGVCTLGLSAVCHSIPVLTSDPTLRFVSFLIFEICVGLYFPVLGAMKAALVPEE